LAIFEAKSSAKQGEIMAVFRGKYFGKISVHSWNNGGYEILKKLKNKQNDLKKRGYAPFLLIFSEKHMKFYNKLHFACYRLLYNCLIH